MKETKNGIAKTAKTHKKEHLGGNILNFLKEFAAEHDKEVLKIHKLIDKLANEFSSLDVIEEDLNEIRDKQGEDSYILHKTAIPYYLAVSKILDDIYRDFEAGENRNNALLIVNSAFNGAYLWSRIRPLIPQLQKSTITDDEGIKLFDNLANQFFLEAVFKERDKKDADSQTNKKETNKKIDTIIKVAGRRAKKFMSGLSTIENTIFTDPDIKRLLRTGETKNITTEKKRNIITPLNIEWDRIKLEAKGFDISALDRLTTFDREVYSAVASLYIADGEDIYKLRHVYVTPREVYQILSGNKKNQTNPTPGILQEISQSLERMSLIRVSINAQAEYDKKLNIKASFTDYLLNTSRERIEINGQLTECIQINTPPILFRYASGKNHIARADIKMLNVPVSNTKDNIPLKGFLVRRVENIKNKKSKIGNVI
ncbi:MAG: hypothetical protein IJQ63_07720 [Synergistaceae bacterium]|nr:hypothetical protein [Synergistaceae bacterium]MBR0221643.1 hypothetical protein [Synergistaceae bacterium]